MEGLGAPFKQTHNCNTHKTACRYGEVVIASENERLKRRLKRRTLPLVVRFDFFFSIRPAHHY